MKNAQEQAYRPRIGILGGGISGLAAAWYLARDAEQFGVAPPEIEVLERGPSVGGVISSRSEGGFLLENGPDAFAPTPALSHLLAELDLAAEPIRPAARRTFVCDGERLAGLPEGMASFAPQQFRSFWSSAPLSRRGKLRALAEPLIPRSRGEISVEDFLRRRLGSELSMEVAEPLAAAILGGNLDRLSAASNLSFLYRMEQRHGSLWRGSRKRRNRRGATPSPLFTLADGLETLVDRLCDRLKGLVSLETGCCVTDLSRSGARWLVTSSDGSSRRYDVLLVCLPAGTTARLVAPLSARAAGLLRRIRYRSSTLLYLAYERDSIAHPLDATGFVVKPGADSIVTSCSFVSSKFDGRCPPNAALLRCSLSPEHARLENEQELTARIERQLARLLGITESPILARWCRHPNALPVMAVGHRRLVEEVTESLAELGGLLTGGSWVGGTGIGDCLQTASNTAHQALLELAQSAPLFHTEFSGEENAYAESTRSAAAQPAGR